MTYSLGIDLGTTYTAAAVIRDGRAEVTTLGYRATSVPTVVVLTGDGTVVVGDAAERRGASAPERLAREFNRRVGDGARPPRPVDERGHGPAPRRLLEAKEALSSETSVDIPVTLPGVNDEVLLRRTELEELVAPVLAPTVDALRRVVASAGLRPGQPDAVLLVGGSSRMPLVAREVSVALGRPVAVDAHPKHPVALGAALVAEARRPVSALARAPGRDRAGVALPPPPPPRRRMDAATGVGLPRPPVEMPPGPRVAPPGPPVDARTRLTAAPGGPRRTAALGAAAVVLLLVSAVGIPWAIRSATDDTPTTSARDDPSAGDVADVGAEPIPPASSDGADLLWEADVSESVGGAPATDGQRVYVVDDTARVSAFDVASGDLLWQPDLGDAASGVTPVVVGGLVIVSTTEPSTVQALDPATGNPVWTAPDIWSSDRPVVVGDTVVVASGSTVTALRLADGGMAWETTVDDSLWSGLALSPAGDLLVASTSFDNKLVAVRADGSGVAWVSESLPRYGATVWDVAIMGDTVLAVDDDGYVNLVGLAAVYRLPG